MEEEGQTSFMWKLRNLAVQKTRGRKKKNGIQSNEGILLTEPKEISERWIECIEEIYAKDDKPDSILLEQEEEVDAERPWYSKGNTTN